MKPKSTLAAALCLLLCGQVLALAQDMDKQLSDLAEKLATLVKEHGIKKITILDFTDLQGGTSELGRYIAEQLTVSLVTEKREFSVVDRAHLNRILAEHKLTTSGLIDPDNAKKLGMFAGVDAFVFGTLTPKDQEVTLTAKIISTETAEVVRGVKGQFKTDKTVEKLLAIAAPGAGWAEGAAKFVKTIGDLRVEVQSLHIVNENQYLLSMDLLNQNQKKKLWVAISSDLSHHIKGAITDPDGFEFLSHGGAVSGIEHAANQRGSIFTATELAPNNSIPVTVKFFPPVGKTAVTGSCHLRLELQLCLDNPQYTAAIPYTISTKIQAN
jgi:curli biogenesis system outer membrane secretion channel CsgG